MRSFCESMILSLNSFASIVVGFADSTRLSLAIVAEAWEEEPQASTVAPTAHTARARNRRTINTNLLLESRLGASETRSRRRSIAGRRRAPQTAMGGRQAARSLAL